MVGENEIYPAGAQALLCSIGLSKARQDNLKNITWSSTLGVDAITHWKKYAMLKYQTLSFRKGKTLSINGKQTVDTKLIARFGWWSIQGTS